MCLIFQFLLIETQKQEAEAMGNTIRAKEINVMVLQDFQSIQCP